MRAPDQPGAARGKHRQTPRHERTWLIISSSEKRLLTIAAVTAVITVAVLFAIGATT